MSQPLAIRPCRPDEADVILEIVNAGAEAYRGVIPADRWHDPYMSGEELAREMAAGVQFSACEAEGEVVGVMGIQPVRNVDLIRHAYVRPTWQGRGIGTRLLDRLRETTERPILIGTWAAATWAIRFYERNGFTLVPEATKARLLKTYWTIPDRQIDTSVVLASPALTRAGAEALMNAS
jgi:GNAT superfamily N-acetyltransferase